MLQSLAGSKGTGRADTHIKPVQGLGVLRQLAWLWGGPFSEKQLGRDMGVSMFSRQQAGRQDGDIARVASVSIGCGLHCGKQWPATGLGLESWNL